ncbi:Lupus La protein [Parasponia andersonii]|uniref:Lupus La protein n=1 Tax=Parasponia andersonii TaxID=3476 RepID=A0A2P5AC13_PARAD|nr:Lupus La protein [Parasponia andersonii]
MASWDEETQNKVLRQVEFYFSDSNLPRDDFLRKSVSQSPNGLVSLALICTFSRMRNFLGLSRNTKRGDVPNRIVKSVAEILRKSNCLRVSDDGKRVGRVSELNEPEEVIEQVDTRTMAVSPLEYDVKIEDLEVFFANFGKINSVRLPFHVADKRCFCGTALIEFSIAGDSDNVLKQNLIYAGTKLELKRKKQFDSERENLIRDVRKSNVSTGTSDKEDGAMKRKYQKGLLIAVKLKKTSVGGHVKTNNNFGLVSCDGGIFQTEKDTKLGKEAVEEAENATGDADLNKPTENTKTKKCEKIDQSEPNNPIEKIEQTRKTPAEKEDNSVLCEEIKDAFQRFGIVKYVDFEVGADSGYICFQEPEAAVRARAAAEFVGGGVISKNFSVFLEAVNGEAEEEYWKSYHCNEDGWQENRDGGSFRRGKKRK